MDKKITGIIAYIALIGWLVAYLAGDRQGAKFHLNQALAIFLVGVVGSLLGLIPMVGWLLSGGISIICFVCRIIGIISAFKEEEKELPFFGQIKLIK